MLEDKLLIWKFKRGSREALRRIYDKHHGRLLKLAGPVWFGLSYALSGLKLKLVPAR